MTEAERKQVIDAQLEVFEQWWDAHGQYVRAGGGQYEVSFAYAAWQAATAAERERAAKVCEERAAYYNAGDDDRPFSRRAGGANACAAAIRNG